MTRRITVSGVDLEVEERGTGRPLLFLHPGEGLRASSPWFEKLAAQFRVIAPSHPGWGNSALPDWIGTVDDLAYLYLDLIRALELKNTLLVGADFGGWIAAEMAVRNTRGIDAMVLAAPLGIKAGEITDRDITDMHSLPRQTVMELAWAAPETGAIDYATLSDMELAAIARGRESWALFGWKPYMHNPHLRHWLHRIDIPTTLIWGTKDRILAPRYIAAWQDGISGARVVNIDGAGHYPHWEQPDAFCQAVASVAT